ncbi:MAG TPA: TIGR01777 family oxidoreductase [Polyangiaceae bacterium]
MSERIVVTGGTGFVGRALVRRLAPKREIVVLTRGGALPRELAELGSVRAASWDAAKGGAWERELDGASAVIHLAGSQAVGVRFTDAVKKRIYDSRVKSGEALAVAIGRAAQRPRVFVTASGVDYYRGRLTDEPVDETEPPGESFLSKVCVDWEGAARAAESFGVRVVAARFAVVLGSDGPLSTMALPFKFFVGGPLGSGRQIFSWVHLEDVVAVLERALDDAAMSGGFNVVAPEALPQSEFAKRLGRVLHRPAIVPAPAFALRALFGEGAEPILLGRRAVPKRLADLGFRFQFPSVDAALADAIKS